MKVRWNVKAFEEIRRMDSVDEDLSRRVEAIREGCGDGYDAHVEPGKSRTRGAVVTASSAAIIDNARHNTLLRNLDRGRG